MSARPLGADFGWVDETLCAALCGDAVRLTPRQLTVALDLDARLDARGSRATVSSSELAVVRAVGRKLSGAWS